jgi:hypothetical protein
MEVVDGLLDTPLQTLLVQQRWIFGDFALPEGCEDLTLWEAISIGILIPYFGSCGRGNAMGCDSRRGAFFTAASTPSSLCPRMGIAPPGLTARFPRATSS